MPEMIYFHFDISQNVGACCVFNIIWSVAWVKKKTLKTADDSMISGFYFTF